MASNNVGKELHRLKQRRQPWQMSKTRSSSLVRSSSSQKSAFCHSMGWRVGASRPPSRRSSPLPFTMPDSLYIEVGVLAHPHVHAPQPKSVLVLLAERIEGLLETVGVGTLRFGQSLKPIGDLAEAFLARGLGHARVHVGVLVGLTGDCSLKVLVSRADGEPRGRVT